MRRFFGLLAAFLAAMVLLIAAYGTPPAETSAHDGSAATTDN